MVVPSAWDHRFMFDPKRHKDCPAKWAYYLRQQELALAGKIDIFDITTAVVGDGCSFITRNARRYCTVSEAISALGVRPLSEDDFNLMCSTFAVKYLVPVADPRADGATWPTIVVPSDDNEYPFVDQGKMRNACSKFCVRGDLASTNLRL